MHDAKPIALLADGFRFRARLRPKAMINGECNQRAVMGPGPVCGQVKQGTGIAAAGHGNTDRTCCVGAELRQTIMDRRRKISRQG